MKILLLIFLSSAVVAHIENDSMFIASENSKLLPADSSSLFVPHDSVKTPIFPHDSLLVKDDKSSDPDMVIKMPSDFRKIEPNGVHREVTPECDPKILKGRALEKRQAIVPQKVK